MKNEKIYIPKALFAKFTNFCIKEVKGLKNVIVQLRFFFAYFGGFFFSFDSSQ